MFVATGLMDSASMTPSSERIFRSRTSMPMTPVGVPQRPKLFPKAIAVSNLPSSNSRSQADIIRPSRTPLFAATSSAIRDRSIPTTSCPLSCRWTAILPAPIPMSRTLPFACSSALFSHSGKSLYSQKYDPMSSESRYPSSRSMTMSGFLPSKYARNAFPNASGAISVGRRA